MPVRFGGRGKATFVPTPISARGFNPGNPQNRRFALKLKGREMQLPDESVNLAPIAAEKSKCVFETCYNWTIGPLLPPC
jgi:hypothetical protein